MQPIRAPSFAEILDDIAADPSVASIDAAQARAATAHAEWVVRLSTDACDKAAEHMTPEAVRAGIYREMADEAPPTAPMMSEEDRVAAELDLGSIMSAADLRHVRRAFARHNHPDLFGQSVVAAATGRMKIANMLIDRRRTEIEAARR